MRFLVLSFMVLTLTLVTDDYPPPPPVPGGSAETPTLHHTTTTISTTTTTTTTRKPKMPRKQTRSQSMTNQKNRVKMIPTREHCLLRPDVYIGGVQPLTEKIWVYENKEMVHKQITHSPGFFKIFDEILVNAVDNRQNNEAENSLFCNTIRVTFDKKENEIKVYNNGKGMRIRKTTNLEGEEMYEPTMAFGEMLSSSNYDDDIQRTGGGRNGIGAKACNVFLKKFTVETACFEDNANFFQRWEQNMKKRHDAVVRDFDHQNPFDGQDGTEVSFQPDLERFYMEKLDDNNIALLSRRVVDVAATVQGITVFLDDTPIEANNFRKYVELFVKGQDFVYEHFGEQTGERWEIAVAPSSDGYQQISFVNRVLLTG